MSKELKSKTIRVSKIKCICKPDTIAIIGSHDIPYHKAEMFCENLAFKAPFEYTRSVKSWYKELIAHKMMYDMNWFPLQTMDTDLDEDEAPHRLIAYNIFFAFYKIHCFFRGE